MAGWRDRITKAANAVAKAKDALDASGLVGDGDAKPPSSGPVGSAPTARSDHFRYVQTLGAADPFELVDQAAAERLAGWALGPAGEFSADDQIGVEFRGLDDPSAWLRVTTWAVRQRPSDPDDPAPIWDFVTAESPAPHRAVDGLGDAAFAAGGHVFVRAGTQVLAVSGEGPEGLVEQLVEVAREAVARL